MGFFQEGSESFPVETALKNSCNVKVAICKKQSGTCSPKDTPQEKEEMRLEVLALWRALTLPDAVQSILLCCPGFCSPRLSCYLVKHRPYMTFRGVSWAQVSGLVGSTKWVFFNDSVGNSRFELSFP